MTFRAECDCGWVSRWTVHRAVAEGFVDGHAGATGHYAFLNENDGSDPESMPSRTRDFRSYDTEEEADQ